MISSNVGEQFSIQPSSGGGVGTTDGDAAPVSVPLDIFGCTVFGIPHIFDSVVLTGLSFDVGLLGLHIASFCSGVNEEAFT